MGMFETMATMANRLRLVVVPDPVNAGCFVVSDAEGEEIHSGTTISVFGFLRGVQYERDEWEARGE